MEEILEEEQKSYLQDENYYYFFRALNLDDQQDIQKKIITDEQGKVIKIRTDRERQEEISNRVGKYKKEDGISLEEVYDHIKPQERKDTNCISLSSSAKISLSYGKGKYHNQYILVKVPKKEFGKNVFVAGIYMLQEIEKKMEEECKVLGKEPELENIQQRIKQSKTRKELQEVLAKRYISKQSLRVRKVTRKKEIFIMPLVPRICRNSQLTEKLDLEKNKVIAILTILERRGKIQPIIPNTRNNTALIQTVERAFSSCELIHYGTIEKDKIVPISAETVEKFAKKEERKTGNV